MTADRYTKTVLTVIAMALTTIAIQNFVPSARAQSQSCGADSNTPCYVRTGGDGYVSIMNSYGGIIRHKLGLFVTNDPNAQ